jgi:hypothetical protein
LINVSIQFIFYETNISTLNSKLKLDVSNVNYFPHKFRQKQNSREYDICTHNRNFNRQNFYRHKYQVFVVLHSVRYFIIQAYVIVPFYFLETKEAIQSIKYHSLQFVFFNQRNEMGCLRWGMFYIISFCIENRNRYNFVEFDHRCYRHARKDLVPIIAFHLLTDKRKDHYCTPTISKS